METLYCPLAKAQGVIEPLSFDGNRWVGTLDSYPLINGIPDLRIASARGQTSYDEILPEWSYRPLEDGAAERLQHAMEISAADVVGRKVLLAGVGAGTELDLLLRFNPASVVAVDFAEHLSAVSTRYAHAATPIRFYIADLCNLPFYDEFDFILSSGVIHHTRSPELAHRNLAYALRPGGTLVYGHIYLDNTHNRRVTIDRERHGFHRVDPKRAKQKLSRYCRLYTALSQTRILKLLNRRRFRAPFLIELHGQIRDFDYNYACALDYYLCRYRHVIREEDVVDWFTQTGIVARRTAKGFMGQKRPVTTPG